MTTKNAQEIFLNSAFDSKKLLILIESLKKLAPKDSYELFCLLKQKKSFLNKLEDIMDTITFMGGTISTQQKNNILFPNILEVWGLDEIEQQVRETFFMKNRKQNSYSVWYKKKKRIKVKLICFFLFILKKKRTTNKGCCFFSNNKG